MHTKAPEAPLAKDQIVSNWLAAGWGVGSMATATMLNASAAALMFYLVSFFKLDPAAVGALMKVSAAALFPRFYDERQSASAVEHVAANALATSA